MEKKGLNEYLINANSKKEFKNSVLRKIGSSMNSFDLQISNDGFFLLLYSKKAIEIWDMRTREVAYKTIEIFNFFKVQSVERVFSFWEKDSKSFIALINNILYKIDLFTSQSQEIIS